MLKRLFQGIDIQAFRRSRPGGKKGSLNAKRFEIQFLEKTSMTSCTSVGSGGAGRILEWGLQIPFSKESGLLLAPETLPEFATLHVGPQVAGFGEEDLGRGRKRFFSSLWWEWRPCSA